MSPPSSPLPLVAALLGALSCLPAGAQPAALTNAPAFHLTTTRHELEGLGHYYRAVATMGTNQFAFIVPKGYSMKLDEANRQLRAVERDDKCAITVRLLETPTNAVDTVTQSLKPEVFRELLLQRFATGRITEELPVSAGGRAGLGFDVTWKSEAGFNLHSRIAFVPTRAGLVEFHLLAGAAELQESKYALNSLMLTFRVAENGRLELPELLNKL